MTSSKPIFSKFLSNENSWKEKWIHFNETPINFGKQNYKDELTPFFGMDVFQTFSHDEKQRLFFEYIKLVSEAQILLEQILIYGFYHFRKKLRSHEEIVQNSMGKLAEEELYHSQAYRNFLHEIPELGWKIKPIYPSQSVMRKLFALVIKWSPLGMTLPGAKIEAFSLSYNKLLKNAYKGEVENSWVVLNDYHHQDEAFHVPLEFDLYNSTIVRTGAFKTLISTLLFILLLQIALATASWRLVKNSFPERSFEERFGLTLAFSKWAIRVMPAFEETRLYTKKLFHKKKPLFGNILSFMHW